MTNAAIKLFTSPPPMSRSLKILEEELGFKLFNRTTTGLKLTVKGAIFYKDIYPIYTQLTELTKSYKKNRSSIINIATYQVKSEYAGFICDYFVKNKKFNIELKENIFDINQSDIAISSKKMNDIDFDVELAASCKAILLYTPHLRERSNHPEYLKELPFIQSATFSSSHCFGGFLFTLKQLGFKGNILTVDDKNIRYNLVNKGAGISISSKGFFHEVNQNDSIGLSTANDIVFDITYYIYLKSKIINKELFIQHIKENSPLSWKESKARH